MSRGTLHREDMHALQGPFRSLVSLIYLALGQQQCCVMNPGGQPWWATLSLVDTLKFKIALLSSYRDSITLQALEGYFANRQPHPIKISRCQHSGISATLCCILQRKLADLLKVWGISPLALGQLGPVPSPIPLHPSGPLLSLPLHWPEWVLPGAQYSLYWHWQAGADLFASTFHADTR